MLERQLLTERLKDFHKDVVPADLLPYLNCLTQVDKEKILAQQSQNGPTMANQTLVDRLIRRENALRQFVQALKQNQLFQVALLFDPQDEVDPPEDYGDSDSDPGDGKGFNIIGTAIDFELPGSLQGNETDDAVHVREREEEVVKKFQDPKSPEAKELRQAFREFLPRGTAFVRTKKGSVISIFRVSSVAAVEKLWKMYESGAFQQRLQELLIGQSFSSNLEEQPISYRVEFPQDMYTTMRQKLEEISTESQLISGASIMSDAKEGDDSTYFDDYFEFPPVYLENGNILEPLELELRDYQFELGQKAVEGYNTIICAPTNSGKTYVALHIVKHHLEQYAAAKKEAAARREGIKRPSVVFVVSTVNLVLQQKQRFEKYLSAPFRVDDISGANSSDLPLKHVLKNHEVVVVTAQILVNALHCSKDQRVDLFDISLLIFDECHHANKDHSYNKIMEQYIALKMQPKRKTEEKKLPQVIGFTASLGVGKANKIDDAQKHIMQICANLDASGVSTVRERANVEELAKYVNQPARKLVSVKKSARDPFEKIVNQVMHILEERVKRLQGKNYSAAPPTRSGQQYRQWVEELYKTAVSEASRYLVTYAEQLREYHIALEINNSTRMKDALKRLKKYFDSLDEKLMSDVDKGLKNLYLKAKSALENEVKKNGTPENAKLTSLRGLILDNYREEIKLNKEEAASGNGEPGKQTVKEVGEPGKETVDNGEPGKETAEESGEPGKETVEENGEPGKEIVEENGEPGNKTVEENGEPGKKTAEDKGEPGKETVEKNGDDKSEKDDTVEEGEDKENSAEHKAKGIVFTRTRESTEALLDWINESDEFSSILKPQKLVGSGDGQIGMTQRAQEAIIEKFKTGACNILLATTVAEEGLDISDCNYVIRYDMMGNEISSVQSRGRVRAVEGKYTVLVDSESGALKRDDKNRFREMLMGEAVARVQDIDPGDFKDQVRDLQKKACLDRIIKRDLYAAVKSQFKPDDVTFHCRRCHSLACEAHHFRRFRTSFHVVIDREFKENVILKTISKPQTVDGVTMNKKIHCKKCNEDWGVTALISGVEWMCLKIKSFALKLSPDATTFSQVKKWKDAPFHVSEVSTEELLTMSAEKKPEFDDPDSESLLTMC